MVGVVEFSNRDDMEYAIKSLDDTGNGKFLLQAYVHPLIKLHVH